MTTDYVSKHRPPASAGNAPFAGMDDGELDELRRSVLHSLKINQDEATDLHEQLRLIRAEVRLRNAKQLTAQREQ